MRRKPPTQWIALAAAIFSLAFATTVMAQEFSAGGLSDLLPKPSAKDNTEPVKFKTYFKLRPDSNQGYLYLEATIAPKWHLYAMTQPEGGQLPSVVEFDDSDQYKPIGAWAPSEPPHVKWEEIFEINSESFADSVVWSIPIQFADGVDGKTAEIKFEYTGQTCVDDGTCIQLEESFTAKYRDEPETREVITGEVGPPKRTVSAGKYANYSIPTVLGIAFLAGLILNIMPCVLPVIGLKVLSFVQQAGENPRRVLMLNLTFAAGILSVFMVLATLAITANMRWGGLFDSQSFAIAMVTIVFAFGLSFLGVWEIPIPGFVSTSGSGKAAQQEGYTGAFLKGVITTILATPCSGPMLIPAVTWAIAQPWQITVLAFFSLGLGMASPFIVIGFKPSLVSWLPKPGEWMETFKKLMGFVMIGTAVFFYNSVSDKNEIPVLTFLVVISLACWMAGRISLLQTFPVRMRNWAAALAVGFAGWYIAFMVLIPQHELEWQPYSNTTLAEQLAEGNVVFIDFTGDT